MWELGGGWGPRPRWGQRQVLLPDSHFAPDKVTVTAPPVPNALSWKVHTGTPLFLAPSGPLTDGPVVGPYMGSFLVLRVPGRHPG